MSRYAPGGVNYSFGPGGLTPAIRAIIYANVAIFVVTLFAQPFFFNNLGLIPEQVVERFQVWRIGYFSKAKQGTQNRRHWPRSLKR